MFSGTRQDGSPISINYIVPKESGPVTYLEGGPAEGIAVNSTKLNDREINITTTRGGKPVLAEDFVITADDKSLRINVNRTNERGLAIAGWLVYDRSSE